MAEEDDDLSTLSTQLGISEEEILERYPSFADKKFRVGSPFDLGRLKTIKGVNNKLNKVQDSWNCANFACGSDTAIPSSSLGNNLDAMDKLLKNKYFSVSEANTKIGSIIRYELKDETETYNVIKNSFAKQFKAKGYSKANIESYLDSPKMRKFLINKTKALIADERHYSIVVLKNKSGTGVQSVIQKSGTNPFEFKLYNGKTSNQEYLYELAPIGGTNNPFYNENN